MGGETLRVLAGLLRDMGVHRTIEGLVDDLDRLGIDRADRMDGSPDGGERRVGRQRLRTLDVVVHRSVAEPDLIRSQWVVPVGIETPVEIQRVEERDPDSDLICCGDQPLGHDVGFGIRRPVDIVMEVVELTHGGVPGLQHLGEHSPCEVVIGVRGELQGCRVHQIPPGPERSAEGVGPAAQRPMEGVTVSVGQTRQHQTVEPDGTFARHGTLGHCGDDAAVDLDRDVVRPPVREEGLFGEERTHDPTSSTNRVMRSTNESR